MVACKADDALGFGSFGLKRVKQGKGKTIKAILNKTNLGFSELIGLSKKYYTSEKQRFFSYVTYVVGWDVQVGVQLT